MEEATKIEAMPTGDLPPYACTSDSSSTTVATTQATDLDTDDDPPIACRLQPGDAVRDIDSGFVGTVKSVVPPGSAMIHFPGLEPDEQDMAVEQLLVVGRRDLKIGQRVTWERSDEDVSVGSVGRLLCIREGDLAVVRFGAQHYCFALSELLAAGPTRGLQAGDSVTWKGFDDEILSGTVGIVIGFKNYLSEAIVKFGEDALSFAPNQLLLKERRVRRSDDPSSDSDDPEEVEKDEGPPPTQPPCYPFPGAKDLTFSIGKVQVVVHDNIQENVVPAGIVIFCPGTHGGVGPCRAAGQNYCPDALFPTLAKMLEAENVVSCRVSWSAMHPPMNEAIQGVARATLHAIARAAAFGKAKRKLRVCLVGHSLGGALVLAAAGRLEGLFQELNQAGEGSPNGQRLVAVCTLAAQASGGIDAARNLTQPHIRKLFLHGSADQVLSFAIAQRLYDAAIGPKELLVLAGGEHDLLAYKEQLIDKIGLFLKAAIFDRRSGHRSHKKSGHSEKPAGTSATVAGTDVTSVDGPDE